MAFIGKFNKPVQLIDKCKLTTVQVTYVIILKLFFQQCIMFMPTNSTLIYRGLYLTNIVPQCRICTVKRHKASDIFPYYLEAF